ncbi:sulfurtransferase TusA family protein [Sulfurisphaera ohwakuensis]|uniref:sulfurtransferase TusA family protein n=1 Tax=Sulfurisphaera ohwakuensis TaxID=69656 RepID=UPI0036F2B60C
MSDKVKSTKPDVTLDLRGEPCPEPQIEIVKMLNHMKEGQVLEILSDDEPAELSIPVICESRGYPCEIERQGNTFRIRILKTK